MGKVNIQPGDLQVHDPKLTEQRAQALIDAALAQARFHAPCIDSIDFVHDDYAKSLIVDAIIDRASRGDLKTSTTGPFTKTTDTRNQVARKPGERILASTTINELRQLCGAATGGSKPKATFPPAPRDLFSRL